MRSLDYPLYSTPVMWYNFFFLNFSCTGSLLQCVSFSLYGFSCCKAWFQCTQVSVVAAHRIYICICMYIYVCVCIKHLNMWLSSLQSLSRVRLLATPWTAACQASLSITNFRWWWHHQQTHVHWVGDAIQPSHPPSPSPLAFNLSQHQGLFKWVSSSHRVAKVFEFQLQHQFFQWTIRTPLGWTGWTSLQSKGLSRVFANTTVQIIYSLVLIFPYSQTLTSILDYWKKP